MEKQDIRVVKSKRALCNALTELVKTSPFRKITVGDICAAAMINKMTFYKHYADKYELLNDVLLSIKQSIVDYAKTTAPTPNVDDSALDMTFRLLDAVIEVFLEKKDLLFYLSRDDMVLTMISTTIEKSVHELLSDINSLHPFKYRMTILSAAVTGSATFLIRYWLSHDQPVSKKQFLENAKAFLKDLFDSKILFA